MKPHPKIGLFAVLLIFAASTLTAAGSVSAQDAAPYTPQFTLNVIDNSQVTPSTKVTDPYTNETITHSGYTLENITVQLKVFNQPFTTSVLPDGNTTELRYIVRFKGHFADWGSSNKNGTAAQTGGAETVFTFFKGWGHNYYESWQILPDVDGAQVDFQVKAQVGYYYQYYDANVYPYNLNVFFVVSESGWSSTQTAVLPSSQGNLSPTQQPTYEQQPIVPPDCTDPPAAVEPPTQDLGYGLDGAMSTVSDFILGVDAKTAFQVILLSVVLFLISILTVAFVSASLRPEKRPPPPPP